MLGLHITNPIYHVAHEFENPMRRQVKNLVQNGLTPIKSFQMTKSPRLVPIAHFGWTFQPCNATLENVSCLLVS